MERLHTKKKNQYIHYEILKLQKLLLPHSSRNVLWKVGKSTDTCTELLQLPKFHQSYKNHQSNSSSFVSEGLRSIHISVSPTYINHQSNSSLLVSGGPFRATQLWNDVISHLKEHVHLKKRRVKMRHYETCFTGTDAVDVVLQRLYSEKVNFSKDVSREKAIKVNFNLYLYGFFFKCSGA